MRLTASLALVAAAAALVLAILVATGSVGGRKTVTVVEPAASAPAQSQGAKAQTTPSVTVPATNATASSTFSALRSIYQRESPAVAVVNTTSVVQDPLFGTPSEQQALGSGFLIDGQGHIVTNYHVVQGAKQVTVNFSSADAPQSDVKATVVGSDPSTDIAVLKASTPPGLKPLPLGNSNAVSVGDPVIAIGNPLGLDRTMTFGIVSALSRQIQSPNGFSVDHVIQTDAAINHGNSGGPLLNLSGQVIGVNSQIATDTSSASSSSGNIGIGFAVPIDTVKTIVSEILKSGHVVHPFLGVRLTQVAKGLKISNVDQGSGAAKAGLKDGDVLVAADGQPLTDFTSLHDIINAKQPGQRLTLEYLRAGQRHQASVVLGVQPKSAG